VRPSASKRDTLITFQAQTSAQDERTGAKGAPGWTNLASDPTEWAEVQDFLPSRGEVIAEGITLANKPCRVRCLYRADINSTMRILIDGRPGHYNIVRGPIELGRHDGLEFICERPSTEGRAQ
jgi:head-tail adaptor